MVNPKICIILSFNNLLMNTFLYQIPAFVIAFVLFVLMVIINYAGHRLKRKRDPEQLADGLGPVEGSLLGLLALLLSFTFSMSAGKSDGRRQVIVQEANNIGTAILRCDLYPDSTRRALKADFAKYLQARIDYYNAGIDETALNRTMQQANDISGRIWKRVMLLSQDKADLFQALFSQLPVSSACAICWCFTTSYTARPVSVGTRFFFSRKDVIAF
jgi:hypothetical protein